MIIMQNDGADGIKRCVKDVSGAMCKVHSQLVPLVPCCMENREEEEEGEEEGELVCAAAVLRLAQKYQ